MVRGGKPFPVVMLQPEDRARIPLTLPKRQLVGLVCEDKNERDSLHLRNLVRAELRAQLTDTGTRGPGNAPVMYEDGIGEDYPARWCRR
jgi:hypothetical protein